MKPRKKARKSSKKKTPAKKIITVAGPSSIKKEEADSEPVRLIKKRKLYARESLQAAYTAVKDSNISVNAAAKQYGVPLTTLRDRVDGRISMETTRPGPPLLMAKDEESEIVHFLHTMARYGYRYTRLDLGEIATDQAVEKGKKNPRANKLTTKWVDNFVGRWPSIRELNCKYKNTSDAEHTVRTYFDEIKKIIDRYKLLDKSNRIFNIMEIGLDTHHGIVSSASEKSGHQFKTENSTRTTMIACGSVSGRVMAPFFVFQAARVKPEMMRGVPSNCNAAVSDSGRCTPKIFRRYLNEHFLPQTRRVRDSDPLLVLMDGSKSHVFVSLAEWGRANNVIFSFVPAMTTHLLQPLEVECAEQVQKKYESMCRRFLKVGGGPCITRNAVADLAYNAYVKVLTPATIIQSFRKAGVYPDISSDESEDEGDDESREDSFKAVYYKTEDDHVDRDEDVYTGDLVVGHNEEVTEEEVITSSQDMLLQEESESAGGMTYHDEILSAQDMAEPHQQQEEEDDMMMPGGQLLIQPPGEMVMVPEGHILIHDGGIFVNSSDGGFSHMHALHLPQGGQVRDDLSKVSPLKQCVISDGKIMNSAATSAVLHDSEFSSVMEQEGLALISPGNDHKLHHCHHISSPSDNSSNSSSNNSIYSSSMTEAAQDPSLDLSSSLSGAGDNSGGTISPESLAMIVKQETLKMAL